MIWEIDDGPRAIPGLDAQGRPDPAYAAALGLIPAPVGRRVLAAGVEAVAIGLLALPGAVIGTSALLPVATGEADLRRMLESGDLLWPIVAVVISNVLVTIVTIVQLVLHGRRGVTLGKAIFGLRSINVRTLERPRFWRGAVVRYLLLSAAFLVPVLGPLLVITLSPLFDREARGRGWLDLAAATWFVDIRRGLNPYDTKRMRIARKMLNTPEYAERPPLPSLATPALRDAPAAYVPANRLSGGVIGAHRPTTPEPLPPTPAVPTLPAPSPSVAPQPSGLLDAVPPPLAPGQVLESFRPGAAPAGPPSTPPNSAQPSALAPLGRTGHSSTLSAIVLLDGGQHIEVRGLTLFGRTPAPRADEDHAQLVTVGQDSLSVSKTHLAVLPTQHGTMVIDRASTNGSQLVRDGVASPLIAGQPFRLHVGDTVHFGEHMLTVEQA